METRVKLEEGTEQFNTAKEEWKRLAKECTVETLPQFLAKITEEYSHDYGTICHAAALAAVAAASAVDHSPQGGITGFQAGAIMWQFIREWNYTGNKTGLKLVDYDNFLYPQYADRYEKTISPSVWAAIQKEAARKVADADAEYAKHLLRVEEYKRDIAAFVGKYPDYYERREHYDPLGMGTGEQWAAEEAKKASGFEFAPQEPFTPVSSTSNVYRHWQSIVAGHVPFGYSVVDD